MHYDADLPPVVAPLEQQRAGCLRWGLALSAAVFNTGFALLVIVRVGIGVRGGPGELGAPAV